MIRKILFFTHLILSVLILLIVILVTVSDIFSVGKPSSGNFFLFTCPACFAIPVAILSFTYLFHDHKKKILYLPFLINLVTIVVGFFLFQFDNHYPDFAFQRHYSEYDEVIKLVDANELEVNQDGVVVLPEKFNEVFMDNVVYSIEGGVKTIYFEEGYDTWDTFSWGYIYRPDGSQPSKDGKCGEWRQIVPATPNWYYCDRHAWVGFPK